MLAVGIDLGGTSIKGAVVEVQAEGDINAYRLSSFCSVPTEAKAGKDAVLKNLCELIYSLCNGCELIAISSAAKWIGVAGV